MSPRVLGVDFGDRRVGLAVSDPLGLTARPAETLEVESLADAVEQVALAADRHQVSAVVVGYPVHLDGGAGARARRVDRFMRRLRERTGLPVVPWDERLSSVAAERVLREAGKRRGPRGPVDRIAASLLLAAYLERHPRAGEPG